MVSMAPIKPVPFKMEPISVALSELPDSHFDVIVVGSGYGGGISAARLARAGQRVCVLERGHEILPGDYPDNMAKAMAATQITTAIDGALTPDSNGMLDLRINADMNVIVGCGLGGTSLINANVALETDPRTFQDPRWPAVFRQDGVLDHYYSVARAMLGSTPLPPQFNPNKLQALEASAKYMGAQFERPPINVTFKDGPNAAGVTQAACNMCGDCCSGCNYGAKNTTLMNYLPDAHRHGAVIATQAQVMTVLKTQSGGWSVTIKDKSKPSDNAPIVLTAATVVLGAGTLGSTEILMRSHAAGLELSDKNLGAGFSGNGDVLAFGFDANWKQAKKSEDRAPVYCIGAGANVPTWETPQYMPGPCITGVIKVDMEAGKPIKKGLVIEEGVAPGALSMIYAAAFFMEEALEGDLFRYPDAQMHLMDIKSIGDAFQSGTDMETLAYSGPLSRTQNFLLMSHDSADGVIKFDAKIDKVTLSWPSVGGTEAYLNDNQKIRNACDGIWANYLENPISGKQFGQKLITVHPVGGCRMGDSGETGVVNDRCAVFTGTGTATHDGLYVCDGSVMPTSLGLNPLLTISAVSERAMDILIKDKGWSGTANAPVVSAPKPTAPTEASPPDTAMPALTNALSQLEKLQQQLSHIRGLIDTDIDAAEASARDLIDGLIDDYSGLGWLKKKAAHLQIWSALGAKEMQNDLGPAIDDILDVLNNVIARLKGDGSTSLLERLEGVISYLAEDVGDFSPSLGFDETMAGAVSAPLPEATGAISNPYEVCAKLGATRKDGAMTANFHVLSPHLGEILKEPSHTANLDGEIICPMLPGGRMQIKPDTGTFELLQQDTAHVETWLMIYSGQLVPDDGSGTDPHYFRGVKTLQRRQGSDWWTDLTTLSVDMWKGTDDTGTHVAQGVIKLGLQQLTAQGKTFAATYDKDPAPEIFKDLYYDIVSTNDLHVKLGDASVRSQLLRRLLFSILTKLTKQNPGAAKKMELGISLLYGKQLATFFGMLIFRTYGGFLAYMKNFPATDPAAIKPMPEDGDVLREGSNLKVQSVPVHTKSGVELQLLRCNGGKLGPVMLAPGFATKAASFALRTVKRNFVEMLCDEGYDVWMFDYRGSPALGETSLQEFTLDDIAHEDWPAAVDVVLKETGAKDVQIVAHCMGSLTCLMALLCGALDKSKVRSLISSQLTTHPVTNWFNQMKADTRTTSFIRNGVPESLHGIVEQLAPSPAMAELFFGLDTIDANSSATLPPIPGHKAVRQQDQAIDLLVWKVPFPNETPCYSPTCHRIYGIYGPVFLHKQLNEATHGAIKDIFGRISTKPFLQIAEIMRVGQVVAADGSNAYLPNHRNLELPITFIAGALNEEFLPDSSLRTMLWLTEQNPNHTALYDRKVFQEYGHMDCFIGRDADRDIFPFIIKRLKTPVPDR
ncbi:MAG: choline dehydrogenase-like flavoprotein/pimeloyl-ACP methyl ester carboxylesterase [Paracoccaceae bacterium]|jgi:choline dehydrogenase-like flavoprotein/pimeloyl-ACP methyl ester carboxylesterase